MKKFTRQFYIIFPVFIFLVLVFLGSWIHFLYTPVVPKTGLRFILPKGGSVATLTDALNKQAHLKHPVYMKWLVDLKDATRQLKAGEYFFQGGSTPGDIVDQIVAGKTMRHAFRIVNGWNIYDVLAALKKDQYVKHTLDHKSLKAIAKLLDINASTPEGLLYPNTYYYRYGTTDLDLLTRAHQAMQKHMAKAWKDREKGLPYYNYYEALIVASMVEKETGLRKEMPIIAGVILKRLKMWMHLQIDSTVIYGLEPHFNGNLTRLDLRRKTPYNTYTKYGLPPTPIAMPDKYAIHAALHPAKTDALYFVATGDGGHVFSETLAEQRKAVQKYQIDNRRNKSKNVEKKT